jgi:putative transcriptional regulator
MPIVITLDMMLAKRKMSLTELSRRIDITIPNLSILKTGKAKALNLSTLDDLCKILDCQPADLLQYMNEKEYKKLMNL